MTASDHPAALPDEEPAVLTAGPAATTAPAPEPAPEPEAPSASVRPRGDVAALVAAVALPLVGVVLTLAARTWLTVAFLMLVPVIVVVYGLGLLVLVRALRRRSLLRRELGEVPRRYRVYAWLWSAAFLVAAVSPTLGGSDLAWSLQAGLVGLSAVVVGIVTGTLWSTYQRDVAWVTDPRKD